MASETIEKNICILGSTGSIGCNTLEVIKSLNRNGQRYKVKYLSSNSNIEILLKQVEEFNPSAVAIQNSNAAEKFKSNNSNSNLEILVGDLGIIELASRDDYDIVVSALVGSSGLKPTIEAIKKGKRIALANKETLVVAGQIVNKLLKEYNSTLIPIDSEHSAILQCLTGENNKAISKLIITASGGPFRRSSIEEIRNATVEDALNHPNWNMGNKITIDSATLMNKGLEVIEAHWLFDVEPDNIKILVHPQSIIHSMVEFIDGSVKAQLGIPDMKIPIQFAITYPDRIASDFERIDFSQYSELTFEEPDMNKFECLKIAIKVLNSGGIFPAVMNAANEIAVERFLRKDIRFYEIPEIIKYCLGKYQNKAEFSIDDIIESDKTSREYAMNFGK
jgi:1-deoxy-D-xylulose-5-phosphate reductoisomerase